MKKLNFINKIIYLLNNVVAISLLLSFFLSNIKPSSFSLAPVIALSIPALILVNILFVIYWVIVGFRKQFLLSVLVLLIGYLFYSPIYKFSRSTSNKDGKELKIMSYNVRKFNIYKWIKDDSIPHKIADFVKRENPDILALQEFKGDKSFKINYPYVANPLIGNYSDSVMNSKFRTALAIYSKYPVINDGVIKSDLMVMGIFADIVKNTDTLRIYNFHLESLGIAPEEEFLGHQDSKSLLKLLTYSMEKQEVQLNKITEKFSHNNYRTIITCDMNNTAYSWVYKRTKNDLQDSFLEKGNGFGETYNFKGFPLRIDYIFIDQSIKVLEHKNFEVPFSDHFPVMATVSF